MKENETFKSIEITFKWKKIKQQFGGVLDVLCAGTIKVASFHYNGMKSKGETGKDYVVNDFHSNTSIYENNIEDAKKRCLEIANEFMEKLSQK